MPAQFAWGHSGIRRIFKSLGLVLGGKAGAGLLSLVYLVLATRFLGPTNYGVLVLVHAYVTTVCGIMEFPAWQAIVRYGTQADLEQGKDRLVRLLRFGTMVELSCGALAVIVAMVLAPVVGAQLGWPPKTMAFAQVYAFSALGSVRSTPAGYLQLIDRFDLLGLHNLIQPVFRVGGTLIVMALGWGLKSFLVAWLIAALAEFAAMWAMGIYLAARRFGTTLWRPGAGAVTQENPGIWRFLFASNVDVTLSEFSGRVAPLIVGWTLGPAATGFYAVAQRVTVVIAQPARILGNTSYVELARIAADKTNRGEFRRLLARLIGIGLAASIPVVLAVSLFPHQIVRLVAGGQFDAAAGLMVMLVFARAIAVAGPLAGAAIAAMGHPVRSVAANLFGSLIFLPILPFLLDRFGLAGSGFQAIGQAVLTSGLLLAVVWRTSREP